MRGDDAWVQDAFVAALEADGWTCVTSPHGVDVVIAAQGSQRLLAEVVTDHADIDAAYGRLLRSVETPLFEDDRGADPLRYALVVPSCRALTAAQRVSTWVRSTLRFDIYEVHEDGSVALHGSTPLTDPDNFQGSNFHHRDDER